MTKELIAVIEDEPDIRDVIEYNLKREGFRISSNGDGAKGLDMIRREKPNLVLLDLMLPGIGGLDICQKLKADSQTQNIPIIIVSAKGEESDIVLGLGLGADDYVCKPFSPKELLARVKAVIRRGTRQSSNLEGERLTFEGLTIDPSQHLVRVDGATPEFTATEFRLLATLASSPERVFTRDHLINCAIGEHAVVSDRNIDVHIRAIRKKLGPYQGWIKTMRGIGYSFRIQEE